MNKKAANKIKNIAKKQEAAKRCLDEARGVGPRQVAKLALEGNRQVRNVIDGKHLAPGVTPWDMTDEELDEYKALLRAGIRKKILQKMRREIDEHIQTCSRCRRFLPCAQYYTLLETEQRYEKLAEKDKIRHRDLA